MNARRRIAVMAASATAASAALLCGPSSASAMSLPSGSCGSGYTKVATYNMVSYTESPSVCGYVAVYYSAATGRNCAIARPITAWAGQDTGVWVCIRLADGTHQSCDGPAGYRYYAGPVYVTAPHTCITVLGGLQAPTEEAWPYDVTANKVLCG